MTEERRLTDKQRAFIEAYLTCWNASQAARMAGYRTRANEAGRSAMSNSDVRAEISRRLSEMAMSADEVLTRLSDHATASLDDFIDSNGNIDIGCGRKAGKLHLVKRYKTTTRTDKDGGVTRITEIELHDPQAALVHLGRHHGLFTDNVAIDWSKLSVERIAEAIAPAIEKSGYCLIPPSGGGVSH